MPRKKNISTPKVQTLAEAYKCGIDQNDICSIDEFLFLQDNVTASEFEKSNPEQWRLICEYIERRRTFKIKQLEKLLINGEATANQIRSYDILVSIDSGDNRQEQQNNDSLTLEAVYPNFIETEIDATKPTT
jgi:hypothetical protein